MMIYPCCLYKDVIEAVLWFYKRRGSRLDTRLDDCGLEEERKRRKRRGLAYVTHSVFLLHHPSTYSITTDVVCLNAASVVVIFDASHHQFQAPIVAPKNSSSLSTR